jgi:hypothetical protein
MNLNIPPADYPRKEAQPHCDRRRKRGLKT